jgi:4-amino-4-deoxy-L-arabinose transferase-like glycosyltransferase
LSRRLEILLITLVFLLAAALRLTDLTRLPPGFSNEEITNISISEMVRTGAIASFYNVGDPGSGREGLYPLAQALVANLLGDGRLPYRILSVWCGLISLALLYSLTRRLFGQFAGLIAALMLTVTFWPVLLSRAVIRETLLLPLLLVTLLIMTRALHLTRRIEPNPPSTLMYTALGVLIASLAYTHWSGLVLIGLFVVFIIYLVVSRQPISRRVLGYSSFALLVLLIVAIPYITFTARVPVLSGFNAFWSQRPESIGSLLSSIIQVVASIGLIGDSRLDHNWPGSALIGPIGLILLTIGLITALRRWRGPNMMLMLLVLGGGLAVDAWSRGAPNFTHMIVALPAIMALSGLGASVAFQYLREVKLVRRPNAFVVVTTLLITLCSALMITNMLESWAARPDVGQVYRARLGNLATYLDRAADGLTTSICAFDLRQVDQTGIPPADTISDPALLDLMMHRKSVDLRFSNCVDGLVLTRGGEPQQIAFADPKARERMAPLFNEWLINAQPIPVAGLPDGTLFQINAEHAVADTFGQMTLSHVEWAPEAPGPSDRAVLPIRMGGYLTFEGYKVLNPGPYKPGDTFTLATYWRADGTQVPDLRLFVHIMRNINTPPILQSDLLNIDSGLLHNRDVFIQIASIVLPPDFPPGEYSVSIGAYSAATMVRLPIFDDNQKRGDRLFLDKITVGN